MADTRQIQGSGFKSAGHLCLSNNEIMEGESIVHLFPDFRRPGVVGVTSYTEDVAYRCQPQESIVTKTRGDTTTSTTIKC